MATVSLILPCYNPPPGWEQNIYANYTALSDKIGIRPELIIVLDGTSDLVNDSALQYLSAHITGLQVIRYPVNQGKGFAIRQGVSRASSEIIIYTDIDFPYTIDSMYRIYRSLTTDNNEVAIGIKDAAYYAHVPYLRRVISRFLRSMTGIFLSLPVTDTQCGLKGFRSNVTPLFLQTTINRYLFDLEFIRNCFRSKKFRIKAIPVTLNEKVQFRKMNYSILLPEMFNFVQLLFKKP